MSSDEPTAQSGMQAARQLILETAKNKYTVLNLSGLGLTEVPKEIGEHTQLEWLHLSQNQLITLPAELGKLTQLRTLALSGNLLTEIPDVVAKLTSLRHLDVSKNAINQVPANLANLKLLDTLSISTEHLRDPFPSLLSAGLAPTRSYLRALQQGAPTAVHEAKLLITGEGRVGKTSLLRALRGDNPEDFKNQETTYGVERSIIELPHPAIGSRMLQLNGWDFGGQDVYKFLHQFFFSEHAIYLLAWKPELGAKQCDIEGWLRRIYLRVGPAARVIVVATHCPKHGAKYLPSFELQMLPQKLRSLIVDRVAIDSITGDGIADLRSAVAKQSSVLTDTGREYPEAWLKARDEVLSSRRSGPTIKYDAFVRICAEHGLDDEDAYTLATVFIQRLGRAVFYGDRTSPRDGKDQFVDHVISDLMVLDAEWLTKAIVQVLQDPDISTSGGILEHRRLVSIWRDHGRSDWQKYDLSEHLFLLRAMEKFEMSYVIPKTSDTGSRSLIVQRIPEAQPILPWDIGGRTTSDRHDQSEINLLVQLGELPEGFIPRLVAATFPYHVRPGGPDKLGLYWQGGVFLKEQNHGCEALFKLVPGSDMTLQLCVRGGFPQWFFGELYGTLRRLLSFWPGMEPRFSIPCPAVGVGGQCCGSALDLRRLLQIRRLSRKTDVCGKCGTEIDVASLLSGIGAAATDEHSTRVTQGAKIDFLVARQLAPCPRLFTLSPKRSNVFSFIQDRLLGRRYEITIWSEYSVKPVEGAVYVFRPKPNWLDAIHPFASAATTYLLGFGLPKDGSSSRKVEAAQRYLSEIGRQSAIRNKDQPFKSYKADENSVPTSVGPIWVEGGELELLRSLFDELGAAPLFAGMKHVKVDDGRWVWVARDEAVTLEREKPVLKYLTTEQLTPNRRN